jgi:hypothetical protein
MKKLFLTLVTLLFIVSGAWADNSTTTVSSDTLFSDVEIIKFSIIANTGGTVTATSSTATTCQSRQCYPHDKVAYIYKVATKMGTPTPADNWDLTIVDDTTGADLLGGEGANISNAASSEFVPKMGNAYGGNLLGSSFTVTPTNITEGSAAFDIYIYLVK